MLPRVLSVLGALLFRLCHVTSAGVTFRVSAHAHRFTGGALATAAGDSAFLCALRCLRRAGCVSVQHSDSACVLIAEEPESDQLAPQAGSDVYLRQPDTTTSAPPTSATTTSTQTSAETTTLSAATSSAASACPADWLSHGDVCFFVEDRSQARHEWSTDSAFCQALGATLATFANQEEFDFLASRTASMDGLWLDVATDGGSLAMSGRPDDSFWGGKWCSGEPETGDVHAYLTHNQKCMQGEADGYALKSSVVACQSLPNGSL